MKNSRLTLFIKRLCGLFAKNNAAKAAKYALMIHIALAMLVMPSGICSQQHQTPLYDTFGFHMNEAAWGCSDFQIIVPAWPELNLALPVDEKARKVSALMNAAPYDHYILQSAEAYQVDPALIKAIIMAESSYNPRAVSRRGAKGLMQLMPVTAKALGVSEPFDPELNIDAGVRYLRKLLDRFDGQVDLALAAYNAGSRHVHNYGGVPPFKATRQYIKKVLKYQKKYQQELATESNPDVAG